MKFYTWSLPLAVFIIMLLALYALSFGWIPGLPNAAQKTVTVFYPPHSEASGLSLFLQPPMASLQIQGRDQVLTLEFTNHSETPVHLGVLHVHPDNCFKLDHIDPVPPQIKRNQTAVLLYRLSFPVDGTGQDKAKCLEPQPLTLTYEWTPVADAPQSSTGTSQPSDVFQQTVSTSPVNISTVTRNNWERFFHAGGAILIPALLGLLTFLFQLGQLHRDEQQKDRDLKLQAWKTIFGDIVASIKRHYVPLSRKAHIVRDEIDTGSLETVLASMLVLRKQMSLLTQEIGGFYFREKRGEDLCSNISNALWDSWYTIADPGFSTLVNGLELTDDTLSAQVKLATGTQSGTWRAVFGALEQHRKNTSHAPQSTLQDWPFLVDTKLLVEMMAAILNFESDRPLYPEWYERPPLFDADGFSQRLRVLALPNYSIPDRVKLAEQCHEYIETIRPECVLKPKRPSFWKGGPFKIFH